VSKSSWASWIGGSLGIVLGIDLVPSGLSGLSTGPSFGIAEAGLVKSGLLSIRVVAVNNALNPPAVVRFTKAIAKDFLYMIKGSLIIKLSSMNFYN
jgi:hypothetical protein